MRIAMIGTGYVGLVSGVCFSDFGHEVVCVDKDPRKLDLLGQGKVPIYESGLEELMAKNVAAGRLSFTGDLASAVAGADAVFIAVGTPSRRGDGHADLSYVHAAAREMAEHLRAGAVVVTKSTVPVGTGDEVERIIREVRTILQGKRGEPNAAPQPPYGDGRASERIAAIVAGWLERESGGSPEVETRRSALS